MKTHIKNFKGFMIENAKILKAGEYNNTNNVNENTLNDIRRKVDIYLSKNYNARMIEDDMIQVLRYYDFDNVRPSVTSDGYVFLFCRVEKILQEVKGILGTDEYNFYKRPDLFSKISKIIKPDYDDYYFKIPLELMLYHYYSVID